MSNNGENNDKIDKAKLVSPMFRRNTGYYFTFFI